MNADELLGREIDMCCADGTEQVFGREGFGTIGGDDWFGMSCVRCGEGGVAKAEAQALQRLARRNYSAYLSTHHWRELRRSAYRAAGCRCQVCFSADPPLQAHHRTYLRVGRGLPSDITVLCGGCHEHFHEVSAVQPARRAVAAVPRRSLRLHSVEL